MQIDLDSWPACWILEMLARTGNADEFRASRAWKKLRAKVRRSQHGQCYCHMHPDQFPFLRGQRPALVPGDTVHHVHPLRERPDLALSEVDENGELNLILVCRECHWPLDHPSTPRPDIPERW